MIAPAILEALAKGGRLDAEALDVEGEYLVGGKRVRVQATARRYVVLVGGARVSLPRTSSASSVARAIELALGTAPKPSEAMPWRLLAGRRFYVVVTVEGRRELVLAASEGTVRRLCGDTQRVDEATDVEDGCHEAVLCEDGVRRPIAVVLSALAAVR